MMKDIDNSNDITHLITNRSLFKAIMDHSLDSLYFKDRDFRFIAVSKNKAIKHGINDPSEMNGKTDFDFISESDAKRILEEEKSILETGHSIVGKIEKIARLDGKTTWASTSKYPLYDDNSKIIGIWGISRDITEYELAKEGLRESEERYSQLSEQSRTFTWELDEQGLLIFVDQASEIVLGYRPDELVGKKHFYDLIPEEERKVTKQSVFYVFTQKALFQNLETKALAKDGHMVWLSINGIPMLNDDGTLRGYRGSNTDITERKQAEITIKESENRLIAAQQMAHVGNWELNLATNNIWATEESFNIYGIEHSSQYLPLKIVQHCVYPEYSKLLDRKLKNLIAKRGKYNAEFKIKKADTGEERYVQSIAVLVVDEKGNPTKVNGTIQDITERKKSEDALQMKHRQLTDIVNFLPDAILAIDMERHVIIWNKAIEKMTRIPASEMIGKCDYAHNIPFYGEARPMLMDLFLGDDKKVATQYPVLTREGEAFIAEVFCPALYNNKGAWVFVKASPLRDQAGNIIGAIESIRDITDRKRTETALKESDNLYRTFIDASSDMIYLKDDQFKHIVANKCLADFFGKTKQEIIGKSDFELMSKSAAEKCRQDDMEVLSIKSVYFSEEIIGEKVYEANKFPVKLMNNTTGVGGFIRDITARKNIENNLSYLNEEKDKRAAELILINKELALQNAKISYLGYHDFLTDLYNRTYFEEEKKRLDTARQLPISIIMGDINGLKLINDGFGHAKGDEVIIEIAKILKSCCREEDIVSRIGGDEFGILLPKTDNQSAQQICNRIYDTCKGYALTGSSIYPSISLGHATKNIGTETMDNILMTAEEYMSRHKLLESKSAYSSIIASIKVIMFEKSQETDEHAERMVQLSKSIGLAMSLTDDQLNELDLLSTLHDIGKMSIDAKILSKPGKLSDEEWIEMRKHPEVGFRIAQATSELVPIAKFILCHHERWDGKGYPQGLIGEQIPLLSRIVAIVDAFDAMTSDRAYRSAMTKEEAIKEMRRCAGTQFDPDITRIFIEKVLGKEWVE